MRDCPFMEAPETRWVNVGDADVAYQIVGDGPLDLLYCFGTGSHVELFWDVPATAELLSGLAKFSRLIFFDRRGTGASGAVSLTAPPTWEEWAEDITAVLDAAESKQTAILAGLDAGPIGVLFAAMHPERVSALILHNTVARFLEAEDYPDGATSEEIDAAADLLASTWGTVDFSRVLVPSRADDEETMRLFAKLSRASSTPHAAAAQYGYILRTVDVRWALPQIQAPTLVLHVDHSPLIPLVHGRYLADHIAGATLHVLPGGDAGVSADYDLADEVGEFLTGRRHVVEIDRVLTTVLFTDIVGSTEQAAALGDQKWRKVLDAHDGAVREQLRRFRGNEIKTTGDGFMASFDGPARAIRCASAISDATEHLGIQVRLGLHTGECEIRGDDLGGLAVHIAARIGGLAASGEILVSGIVKDLVAGSGLEFEDRGEYELKGVPGSWHLYSVK
jgi:class 3 adenylate cyclase